ncbi:hypothetical protein BV25DRAFT_1899255 [Artomyces pyxidatus]|uniref:Uncharacterized protein n=1 Tax=Artomyces pyxidatus TaxID=48021 RepID=A0ACB8T6W7_9AGAM|nr:hypothetical protein BV25DRAFT_1899255 [Artomyces pyxidatus]
MRFTLSFFAAAVATSVSASTLYPRQLGSFPACAIPCLLGADFGSCAQTDLACLCASPAFITSTNTCFNTSCTGDDLAAAIAAAVSTCESVGVTLTSSVPLSTATSSDSATATASVTPTPAPTA